MTLLVLFCAATAILCLGYAAGLYLGRSEASQDDLPPAWWYDHQDDEL